MFPLSCEPTAYSFANTPIGYLPITARLLLQILGLFCAIHSDDLLDKCQTKSFEGNEHSTQSNSQVLYHQPALQFKDSKTLTILCYSIMGVLLPEFDCFCGVLWRNVNIAISNFVKIGFIYNF